ncbi:MAG: hemolysin-type calcium-binding repeat family protein [Rhizobium sp.]|nr:hemolysin-type calcium-binding repeat family protein [Rhizobium sp.]
MATFHITNANNNVPVDFSGDGDIYIVNTSVTMSVSGDNAFFGATAFTENTIQILGTVKTTTREPTIFIRGSEAFVQLGDAGRVASQSTAIWLTGPKGGVFNNGRIDAKDFGIKIENIESFVKNIDKITSDGTGIRIEGTGGEIENYGTITAVVGVKGLSGAGDTLSLFNQGTITGSQYSFNGSGANDTLLNQGSMVGDIYLLGGNDIFNNTGGTVNGTVFGGFGNDTYTVGDTSVVVEEVAGEGDDKVVARISYILKTNIETLSLSGNADINGTGNGLSNKLAGNGGANTLKGAAGDDILAGGQGNDKLVGGGGIDIFVFANRMGKDRVTDFVPEGANHDIIDLGNVSAITDFADLKANHLEKSGSDVVIFINNGDTITIEGVKINDLHANDFLF